jgi:cysteine synthase A
MHVTGDTPLIPIGNGLIWAKLETHNRTGSVKDRMINYIMSVALQYKNVKPGVTTIVEATSGNTGISLASYAASIGCPCKIIMPQNMSSQRKDMMLAFGAEIIETPDNDFLGAIDIRNKMIEEEDVFSPMQFSNPLNVDCHYNITAPEIYEQCVDLMLDWRTFVHGSGTGGTMMGMKRYIDDNGLAIKCVLTQPAEDNASHGIQGINDGDDFLLDRSLMDATISIKTEDAIKRMKQFWQETGILVGISSGANILAAENYLKTFNPPGIIITVLCDRGERYL